MFVLTFLTFVAFVLIFSYATREQFIYHILLPFYVCFRVDYHPVDLSEIALHVSTSGVEARHSSKSGLCARKTCGKTFPCFFDVALEKLSREKLSKASRQKSPAPFQRQMKIGKYAYIEVFSPNTWTHACARYPAVCTPCVCIRHRLNHNNVMFSVHGKLSIGLVVCCAVSEYSNTFKAFGVSSDNIQKITNILYSKTK